MRLLTYVHDADLASEIILRLHHKGIPTLVKGTGVRGLFREAIFVCLNVQFDDARALLDNPDHEVAEPVDVDAFKRDVARLDGGLLTWGFVALVVVFGFVAFVVHARMQDAEDAQHPPFPPVIVSGSECPSNVDTTRFIERYLAAAHQVRAEAWSAQGFKECNVSGAAMSGGVRWRFDVNSSGAGVLHPENGSQQLYYACDAACVRTLGLVKTSSTAP
jgi:hypothetical protein